MFYNYIGTKIGTMHNNGGNNHRYYYKVMQSFYEKEASPYTNPDFISMPSM